MVSLRPGLMNNLRRIFAWDSSCGMLNIFCICLHIFAYFCISFWMFFSGQFEIASVFEYYFWWQSHRQCFFEYVFPNLP